MISGNEHHRNLERMYAAAPINAYFRPVLAVSERKAEVEIAVRPEFFHAANAVHGSVYFKALDDAAYFAVSSIVSDAFIVTVSFNIYLMRPISEGVMRATGRIVHESRSLFIAEAELVAERGREIGRGSGTFMRSSLTIATP